MKRLGLTMIIALQSMVAMGNEQVAATPNNACQCTCKEASTDTAATVNPPEEKPIAQESAHRLSVRNL